MTISEMKNGLSRVIEALDTVEARGYGNRAKLNDSMAVLQNILQSEIVADAPAVKSE